MAVRPVSTSRDTTLEAVKNGIRGSSWPASLSRSMVSMYVMFTRPTAGQRAVLPFPTGPRLYKFVILRVFPRERLEPHLTTEFAILNQNDKESYLEPAFFLVVVSTICHSILSNEQCWLSRNQYPR